MVIDEDSGTLLGAVTGINGEWTAAHRFIFGARDREVDRIIERAGASRSTIG
jgi:hypothetical protein